MSSSRAHAMHVRYGHLRVRHRRSTKWRWIIGGVATGLVLRYLMTPARFVTLPASTPPTPPVGGAAPTEA